VARSRSTATLVGLKRQPGSGPGARDAIAVSASRRTGLVVVADDERPSGGRAVMRLDAVNILRHHGL